MIKAIRIFGKIIFTLSLFLTTYCSAQNLVQNGGFETYTTLPTNLSQWNNCVGWSNVNGNAGWPSGTADYLHNSGTSFSALSADYFAEVSPHSGDAVMGIICKHNNVANHREYIATELSSPLVVGTDYTVSFWITHGSPRTGHSSGTPYFYGSSMDHFGIQFTTAAMSQTTGEPIGGTPQIEITAEVWHPNWTFYTFSYTATSAYQHITIGNFYNDASTSTTVQEPTAQGPLGSYFFIDDVSVEVTAIPCTAGAASSTPTICINNPLTPITHTTVGATGIANDGVPGANGLPAGVSATWSGNTITISGTPTVSGTFNYSILLDCGAVNATGTITVNPVQPGGLCEGLVLWLKADAGVTGASPVTAWDDQSGFNNHTTANNTPELVSSAINYNPAVDFDGTNEYFETSTTDILLGSQAYTKFAVVAPSDVSAVNPTVIAGSATNPHVLKMNGGRTVMRHSLNSMQLSTNSLQNNTPHMMTARYGATETEIIRLDGNEDSPGNTTEVFVDGKTQIGCRESGRNDWDGYIAEAIEFSNDITDTDIGKVETYLAIKYGLTLDNTAGGTTGDYIATTGTTIWDADDNPSYHNNIIGIAREDSDDLNQRQSHTLDDTTRIYTNSIAATNSANTGFFTSDYAFILMGDNQGQMKATATSNAEVPGPCSFYSRLEREWKVTRTSSGRDFSIDVTLNAGAAPLSVNNLDLGLLIDDDGDFANGVTSCYYNGDASGVVISYSNSVITVSNISASMVPNNSTRYITIGSFNSATPLPVDLLSFEAECNDNNVALNWSTASEINNDYFTIERSTDAANFETVGTVNGNGNSNTMISYTWSDDSPLSGTAYYRLKQTDFNGAFEYHGVRAVTCKQINGISIYPNPFENSFTVQLSENTTYPITVEIIDYLGRNIHSQVIQSVTTKIALNELAKGTYFIKVFNETTRVVERIVKFN